MPMHEEQDAEEYERLFLERYLRAQAKKKIERIEAKLEKCRDSAKETSLIREKAAIEAELERDLEDMERKDSETQQYELDVEEEESDHRHNEYTIPGNLWNKLFKYQQDGVIWMLDQFSKGRGGILADEMGLGKTIQTVTFIAALLYQQSPEHVSCHASSPSSMVLSDDASFSSNDGDKRKKRVKAMEKNERVGKYNENMRILVACPVTVISYWMDELERAVGDVATVGGFAAKGSGKQPKDTGNSGRRNLVNQVTVTSYEQFRRKYGGEKIDLLVLDEGHKIKNREANITLFLKNANSRSRFILTGTPIQNSLCELWSLMDFVAPGLLGSYVTFQDEFESNIYDKRDQDISYRYSTMLRAAIEPYILRRTKTGISSRLPGRSDHVVFIPLTPIQEELYVRALESDYVMRATESKGNLLGAVDYLRKICNHPLLLERGRKGAPGYDMVESACKVKALLELLGSWEEEQCKVLIFTQTVQMQSILATVLQDQKLLFLRMSGKTAAASRKALIEQFQKDRRLRVFLLTTRVGGLGLNLTSANRIILYDPDWNPSTDNQAKERVHRYGQKSAVETYRFICKNTIEEKIYQRQIYKDSLTRKILANPLIRFSRDAFEGLFDYSRSIRADTEIRPYEEGFIGTGAEAETGVLDEVREEDKGNFALLKEMNDKKILSGPELIDYIKRRELSL